MCVYRAAALTSFLSDFYRFPNELVSESGRWSPLSGLHWCGLPFAVGTGLPHGEIRGVRDRVASSGELQGVRARRESGCLEVENVSASRTQRRVKAEIATGIRVTRRGRRAGVTGPAGHLSHVQRYGGGGNVAAIYVAEIKLDREGRTAVDRSRLVVERRMP